MSDRFFRLIHMSNLEEEIKNIKKSKNCIAENIQPYTEYEERFDYSWSKPEKFVKFVAKAVVTFKKCPIRKELYE